MDVKRRSLEHATRLALKRQCFLDLAITRKIKNQEAMVYLNFYPRSKSDCRVII